MTDLERITAENDRLTTAISHALTALMANDPNAAADVLNAALNKEKEHG